MTTDLVGPMPTITFRDKSQQAYKPPSDTMDPRYAVCTDHHPACDCREAERSEDRNEHKAAMDDAKKIIARLVDAPCPPSRRQDCTTCMDALSSWLQRYESAYPTTRGPF